MPNPKTHLAVLNLVAAAQAAVISCRAARKWQRRFLAEGQAGLLDRRSRPHPWPRRTDAGKAERFIQTALREWAYAYRYSSSAHRADELAPWMHHDNFHRPHSATESLPPATRLGFAGYGVLRNYS